MERMGSPPIPASALSGDLLGRARDGDASAETALFTALDARIRALAKKKVWDPQAAEDLAQETLKTIYEKYRTADLERGILPWAFMVFHNKMGNYLKRRRVEGSGPVPAVETAVEDAAIHALEAWEPVEKALGRATESCRKIFHLLLQGADREEILAAFPGEAAGTVDSRVSRCRKRLLDAMGSLSDPRPR